ncbi:MAG: NifB/NifX family molybdenum-iron cluster-binding protein [Desulfobacterales bacterium]|nr:NifB/NifX family molybdenum-iron cluster-binding protein [Desulfobacterales bacterium]MBS3754322.1 NifB/NifX family molybdenum-iron cluster-binding protein [Desulfobacterales bacterium]
MKFAIPLANGQLAAHFGHCREFAFIEVEDNKIAKKEFLVPPPHEPGVLPQWLAEQRTNVVLAGGIGRRAIDLLDQAGVRVVAGVPVTDPESLVNQYIQENLETGDNLCAGGHGSHECGGH